MTERYFRGAPSKWGEGKMHRAVYHEALARWVPRCQNLNPLKGGHDVYDGNVVSEGAKRELTCKRCLAQAAEEAWEPIIHQVAHWLVDNSKPSYSWDTGLYHYATCHDMTWKAKRLVTEWAQRFQFVTPPDDPSVVLEDLAKWPNQNVSY